MGRFSYSLYKTLIFLNTDSWKIKKKKIKLKLQKSNYQISSNFVDITEFFFTWAKPCCIRFRHFCIIFFSGIFSGCQQKKILGTEADSIQQQGALLQFPVISRIICHVIFTTSSILLKLVNCAVFLDNDIYNISIQHF